MRFRLRQAIRTVSLSRSAASSVGMTRRHTAACEWLIKGVPKRTRKLPDLSSFGADPARCGAPTAGEDSGDRPLSGKLESCEHSG